MTGPPNQRMRQAARRPAEKPWNFAPDFFHFAGVRYWTASLLPALVGTTLPFWLRPADFSFKWLGAIEFLLATVLLHAGFSFLLAHVERRPESGWPGSRLLGAAGGSIFAACLLGLHLNGHAPGSIFIVYGLSVIFAGLLYVAPPFSFHKRAGGEIVISKSLGMLPVLGAYLVQTGDLTRTVYLASLPLVVATGLWVWTAELASQQEDEKRGRQTMVLLFGPHFSGRIGVLALSTSYYATIFLAIYARSLMPLALITLLLLRRLLKIVTASWRDHASQPEMNAVCRRAFMLHLATGLILAASSLAAVLR